MGRRFLELGASLSICGRRAEVLEATAAEHRTATGGTVRAYPCDIRDGEAVERMIAAAETEEPLAALVNNAAGNFLARSEDLSPRAVDAVVGIVLKGSLNATLALGRRWLGEGRRGTVLSIVTSYAWTGSAYVLPSAVAKAGVLAMTRSLAVEWGGRGIRLNAIAPGPFPTEGAWERLVPRPDLARAFETRNPLGRPGEHRELADLAAYLLADGSAYINGEVVTIDGGEWLQGAGQFSFLIDMLGEADWQALRPKKG
jgi:NAD(P)-dependent dehydrogenase (short-subunit alcohol dehydrogenase family)